MKNIILIGMPGAGKSTIGVILAKTLGIDFMDTDIEIQKRTGEVLCKTLERVGVKGLLDEEENAIRALDLTTRRCVVATGGSAVLRDRNAADMDVSAFQKSVHYYIHTNRVQHAGASRADTGNTGQHRVLNDY